MAAREHQGYQIALVIFVMTTVLLSITTFMFFRKYKEEQDKNAQAKADISQSGKENDDLKKEIANLKPLLGYTTEGLDVIAKDVEADRAQLAAYLKDGAAPAAAPPMNEDEFAEEAPQATEITNPLNYREIVKNLKIELDKRSADAVKLADDKEVQVKTIAANRAEDKGKIDAATAGQEKAQTELTAERGKFNEDRTKFKADSDKLVATLSEKQKQMDDLDAQHTAKINELTNRVVAVTRDRQAVVDERIRNAEKNFEQTDGAITHVIARDRTVYINLGSADGLRPQVTFSVYSRDNDKLAASESKAKVEVIQISGPKSSIARIIEDSRGDPIMPGDKVFSPAFHPGRKVHFAIAGVTDIDGDGDSDRQRIKDLISINGGIIDVEVTDDGKLAGPDPRTPGQMKAETRYLILGDPPTDPKLLDMRSDLISKAREFGVQQMNVQQFLDMMGYKTDERTVGLGRGADPRDFTPKTGAYDKPFRERRPPGAANGAR